MKNALSVDLEDYFMASAFEPLIDKSSWNSFESRLDRNTDRLLFVLDQAQAKSTFFTVGWVGAWYPEIVRRVQREGHEIACHSYFHELVYDQTEEEFRQDIRLAKQILEKITGVPVIGYRAPSFSITPKSVWALRILVEEGFLYDSSILPGFHSRGGFAGARRYPHELNGLAEFPISTIQLRTKSFPFCGGGFFRLLPYRLIKSGIQSINNEGQPAIIYLHPWEIDPYQPRLKAPVFDRFKHYVNLKKTEQKLKRLLDDFEFDTVQSQVMHLIPSAKSNSQLHFSNL